METWRLGEWRIGEWRLGDKDLVTATATSTATATATATATVTTSDVTVTVTDTVTTSEVTVTVTARAIATTCEVTATAVTLGFAPPLYPGCSASPAELLLANTAKLQVKDKKGGRRGNSRSLGNSTVTVIAGGLGCHPLVPSH